MKKWVRQGPMQGVGVGVHPGKDLNMPIAYLAKGDILFFFVRAFSRKPIRNSGVRRQLLKEGWNLSAFRN